MRDATQHFPLVRKPNVETVVRFKAALFIFLTGSGIPAFSQESFKTLENGLKQHPAAILASSPAAPAADTLRADCVSYGSDVALDGVLQRATATRLEGETVTYYLLKPDVALCVNEVPLSAGQALQGVKAVQIAARPEDFNNLTQLVDSLVTVRGVLFRAITAHHFQPLLIDLDAVDTQSAATIEFRAFWSNFQAAASREDCGALVGMAATPLASMGSLDSDPVHRLDRTALRKQCPAWLRAEAGMREGKTADAFTAAGDLPPANWRNAVQFDTHARFDAFEFEYGKSGWRWTTYYRQHRGL